MKVQSKVGFLAKNADTIEYIPYYEVFDYCCQEIEKRNLVDDFNNSVLSPFDYVMGSLEYIFVNPLFNNDKYLVCRNSLYYTVDKQKVLDTVDINPDDSLYQNVLSTFYDKMDSNIFMLQVTEDVLEEVDFLEESMDCFIKADGKIIKKHDYCRHSALANTICNDRLIKDMSFSQLYFENFISSTHCSELFLVGKCNFIEIDYESDTCVLLYNEDTITDLQKEAIKNVIGEDVIVQNKEVQNGVTCIITQSSQKLDNSGFSK